MCHQSLRFFCIALIIIHQEILQSKIMSFVEHVYILTITFKRLLEDFFFWFCFLMFDTIKVFKENSLLVLPISEFS